MIGAILTFILVCVIVATYMSFVHSFLRASEKPEDMAREEKLREPTKPTEPRREPPRKAQWAH